MKQSCRDLEPLLTPYVDGEASADQCAAVETHLSRCPTCRDCADALTHVRQLLHECREHLHAAAPPSLHARCAELAREAAGAAGAASTGAAGHAGARHAGAAHADETRGAFDAGAHDDRGYATVITPSRWRRWATPLSVAATLVLVVVGIFAYGFFDRRGTAYASQLAADHKRCVRLFGAQKPANAVEQAAVWERTRGWRVPLPESSPPDNIEFIMLRRCLSTQGSVAHALYKYKGQIVSLYIAQRDAQRAGVREVAGQQTCVWNDDGYSYAIVGTESPEEMARLVTWFRRRLEGMSKHQEENDR